MTLEQALRILDDATSRALLTRADHYQVQLALETVQKEINETNDEIARLRKELEGLKKK